MCLREVSAAAARRLEVFAGGEGLEGLCGGGSGGGGQGAEVVGSDEGVLAPGLKRPCSIGNAPVLDETVPVFDWKVHMLDCNIPYLIGTCPCCDGHLVEITRTTVLRAV